MLLPLFGTSTLRREVPLGEAGFVESADPPSRADGRVLGFTRDSGRHLALSAHDGFGDPLTEPALRFPQPEEEPAPGRDAARVAGADDWLEDKSIGLSARLDRWEVVAQPSALIELRHRPIAGWAWDPGDPAAEQAGRLGVRLDARGRAVRPWRSPGRRPGVGVQLGGVPLLTLLVLVRRASTLLDTPAAPAQTSRP